jgi:hypothetical protein
MKTSWMEQLFIAVPVLGGFLILNLLASGYAWWNTDLDRALAFGGIAIVGTILGKAVYRATLGRRKPN